MSRWNPSDSDGAFIGEGQGFESPQLHQGDTALDLHKRWSGRGDRLTSRLTPVGTCSPCVPPAVQAVQAGLVGSGAEVVQIHVRRGDRGVSHPGLNGGEVDSAGEPETCRRMAQVMDPSAAGQPRPVDGAFERGGVELMSRLRDEEELVARSSPREPLHDRQYSIVNGDAWVDYRGDRHSLSDELTVGTSNGGSTKARAHIHFDYGFLENGKPTASHGQALRRRPRARARLPPRRVRARHALPATRAGMSPILSSDGPPTRLS